jgi:dUTP pyrophosphatase
VHPAYYIVHLLEFCRGSVDDEIGTLGDDVEMVVGDKSRDLDDHVPSGFETGHFEIHPHEHWFGIVTIPPLRCETVTDILVVRLDGDLPLPEPARPGDAGIDLRARTAVTIPPAGGRALVPTGIAMELPSHLAGLVLPRSGLALRHGITCLNAPGLVDSGYRGEIAVILLNTDRSHPFEVVRGERIAQLVVVGFEAPRFVEVSSLSQSERGAGGFGHTGTS